MKTETGRKGKKRENEKRKNEGSKCWYNITNEGKYIITVIHTFNED